MPKRRMKIGPKPFQQVKRAIRRLHKYGQGQSIPGEGYIHQDVYEANAAWLAFKRIEDFFPDIKYRKVKRKA